ncbi:hypothetical protein [Dactylosporangium sp. CA-233914]|uniref:hypothetical protein n=1 Tax=Dactylosporangium sp. CA-233914 TaxID=3239934 RepID=UPI003D8E2E66
MLSHGRAATALGEETGILATWLAARRPSAVRRLVVLAPLYAPHPAQLVVA